VTGEGGGRAVWQGIGWLVPEQRWCRCRGKLTAIMVERVGKLLVGTCLHCEATLTVDASAAGGG